MDNEEPAARTGQVSGQLLGKPRKDRRAFPVFPWIAQDKPGLSRAEEKVKTPLRGLLLRGARGGGGSVRVLRTRDEACFDTARSSGDIRQ